MRMATVAVSIAVCASALISAQMPAKLDYDAYCKLPTIQAKQQAMSSASNENGFEILHTHYQRFLDTNRARLNADQTALLQETIAALRSLSAPDPTQTRADRVLGTNRQLMTLAKLVERQRTLLSTEDNQRLKPTTGCFPKS
jgi:hypothetical protein